MFLDTNVLVRARFEAAPSHRLARRLLSEAGEADEALHISRQVIREYLATVTRPQARSLQIPMGVPMVRGSAPAVAQGTSRMDSRLSRE